MLAAAERRRPNAHAVVGVALYALFLVTAPFEHHDLVCHFKTPTHCTACTSSLVGASPNAPAAVGAADLPYAGGAFAAYITGNVASNLIGRLISAAVVDTFGLASNFYFFASPVRCWSASRYRASSRCT